MDNKYDRHKIGSIICSERKAHNLSQEELGEKLNCTRQTVSKWERGDTVPLLEDILKMCNIFNCEAGYLLGEYKCKTRVLTDICAETALSEKAVCNICSMDSTHFAAIGGMVISHSKMLSKLLEDDKFHKLLSDIAFSVYERNSDFSRYEFEAEIQARLQDKGSLITDLSTNDLINIVYPLNSYMGVVALDKEKAAELELTIACDTLKEIVRKMWLESDLDVEY